MPAASASSRGPSDRCTGSRHRGKPGYADRKVSPSLYRKKQLHGRSLRAGSRRGSQHLRGQQVHRRNVCSFSRGCQPSENPWPRQVTPRIPDPVVSAARISRSVRAPDSCAASSVNGRRSRAMISSRVLPRTPLRTRRLPCSISASDHCRVFIMRRAAGRRRCRTSRP